MTGSSAFKLRLRVTMDAGADDVDLYELLEIQRGATKAEVKKSYHKLALRHHPDKAPLEERDEATTHFKLISQAYEILQDDEKREMYDTHGMKAFAKGGMEDGMDMNDLFAQMFGGGFGGGFHGATGGFSRPTKGEDEQKPLPATLEELYKGRTKKFAITKKVLCSHCKGKGAKESAKPRPCSSCKGKGSNAAVRQMGPMLVQQEVQCDVCSGSGKTYSDKEKCKKCKGQRTQSERKVLEVYIPPGTNNGDKIVLQGEADRNPDQEAGDIVFHVEQQEHPVYTRAGTDLSAQLHVTLAEALCGFSRIVTKTLDDRGLHVDHQKPAKGVLRPGQVLKIQGEGMPIKKSAERGDLYLEVDIQFPNDDSLQDSDVTSKLRELLPKPEPPITAETVDDVSFESDADIRDFGGNGGGHDSAWEDEDEAEGAPQCAQQ